MALLQDFLHYITHMQISGHLQFEAMFYVDISDNLSRKEESRFHGQF